MKPEDVKLLLEEIKRPNGRRKIVWDEEQRGVLRRSRLAVLYGRWLDAKDAWILQAMYRRTQGGSF